MKKWLLQCSTDGDMVDYDEIIESETEPEYWQCQEIAENHDCELWCIDEYIE